MRNDDVAVKTFTDGYNFFASDTSSETEDGVDDGLVIGNAVHK